MVSDPENDQPLSGVVPLVPHWRILPDWSQARGFRRIAMTLLIASLEASVPLSQVQHRTLHLMRGYKLCRLYSMSVCL